MAQSRPLILTAGLPGTMYIYCQAFDKKESTAHTHVCVYPFLCTLNTSPCTCTFRANTVYTWGKKDGTTTYHLHNTTNIVPKLTIRQSHIMHSVLTDILS